MGSSFEDAIDRVNFQTPATTRGKRDVMLNGHVRYLLVFFGGLLGLVGLLSSFKGRRTPPFFGVVRGPWLIFPVLGSLAMKKSILISEKQLGRELNADVNRDECISLKNINPTLIANLDLSDLEELKDEGLALLSQQMQNIKAIDDRSMKLMAAMGIVFSLSGALIVSVVRTNTVKDIYGFPIFYMAIAFLFTLFGLLLCLAIIQSTEVAPPGYSPITRLKDLNDKYSSHEMTLEYILSLSRRIKHNDILIKLNGRRFKYSSSSWFIAMFLVLLCFIHLIV